MPTFFVVAIILLLIILTLPYVRTTPPRDLGQLLIAVIVLVITILLFLQVVFGITLPVKWGG